MNYDLPIEQLVRRTDTRFQLGFATEARERIPGGDGFLLTASLKGLHVFARNEDELAPPLAILREAYGAALQVAPPVPRLIQGVQVREPIMHVRIALHDNRYLEAVKRALLARGAAMEEQYVGSRHAVLRFEAPLARLIGLPAELAQCCAGAAHYWIALSHYALVNGGPGGRAA